MQYLPVPKTLDRNITGTLQTIHRKHIAISIRKQTRGDQNITGTHPSRILAQNQIGQLNAKRPWQKYEYIECQAEHFNKHTTGTLPEHPEALKKPR